MVNKNTNYAKRGWIGLAGLPISYILYLLIGSVVASMVENFNTRYLLIILSTLAVISLFYSIINFSAEVIVHKKYQFILGALAAILALAIASYYILIALNY